MNTSHYMHLSRPNSGNGNVSSNHIKGTSSILSKTATPLRSSIVQSTNTERTKEFLLSIGRIFHKIGLVDSEITVTRYRPRHPYPPINVDYRYRFQAPQHSTYEISGVNFTTEKLEHFNWNFMDQYICTRGDTDYLLQEVVLSFVIDSDSREKFKHFFFLTCRTLNIGVIECIYCQRSIWQQRRLSKVPRIFHAISTQRMLAIA